MGKRKRRVSNVNYQGFLKFLDELAKEARPLETSARDSLFNASNALSEAYVLVDKGLMAPERDEVVESLADALISILACADRYTAEFGTVVAMRIRERGLGK